MPAKQRRTETNASADPQGTVGSTLNSLRSHVGKIAVGFSFFFALENWLKVSKFAKFLAEKWHNFFDNLWTWLFSVVGVVFHTAHAKVMLTSVMLIVAVMYPYRSARDHEKTEIGLFAGLVLWTIFLGLFGYFLSTSLASKSGSPTYIEDILLFRYPADSIIIVICYALIAYMIFRTDNRDGMLLDDILIVIAIVTGIILLNYVAIYWPSLDEYVSATIVHWFD